jgi:hypothetical protein
MEVIREVRTVKSKDITIRLPKTLWGQKVEIIILPLEIEPQRQEKNLRGCLKQYANPDLIKREKNAWQEAIGEQYETR